MAENISREDQIIGNIINKKKKLRNNQANLPIEEKIKILIELQKITVNIKKSEGKNDNRIVWEN